jgi:sigma-B regulation protein RsbU (phosphoserine phosphatase)
MEKQNNLYFTIWYGVFNKATRELKYATAGHPPALLVSEGNEIRELITPSMFIGGMEGIDYAGGAVEVELPARLYILSDGAYEVTRPDGSMWSLKGLKEFIANQSDENPSEIETLYRFLQEMHGSKDLEDDFSMVKIEFRQVGL